MGIIRESSSFRDRAGYVFYSGDDVFRAINASYKEAYDALINTGLADALVKDNLLLPFTETTLHEVLDEAPYKILKPERLEFISYPYEWCFSQLKDAALTTLKIHRKALDFGMVLKDASAFNVQFHKGKPVFIDLSSFELYADGAPWVAYSQFCRHFLAPLLLMKNNFPEANKLQMIHIDGLPLPLASALLPNKTRFNLQILSHIHWHAASQKHYERKQKDVKKVRLSKKNHMVLIDSLISYVSGLSRQATSSEWGDYYSNTNYTGSGFSDKETHIRNFTEQLPLKKVVDFGANDGTFSRIFSKAGIQVISLDIDYNAVEYNYKKLKAENDNCLYPLLADITNPTPACGWMNTERLPLLNRLNCDLALALALVHHLFITHHLSFDRIAAFFSGLCNHLIIEFVPFSDSQIQKMVLNRTDNYNHYTQEAFEEALSMYFDEVGKQTMSDSGRVLYFYKKK